MSYKVSKMLLTSYSVFIQYMQLMLLYDQYSDS